MCAMYSAEVSMQIEQNETDDIPLIISYNPKRISYNVHPVGEKERALVYIAIDLCAKCSMSFCDVANGNIFAHIRRRSLPFI